MKAALFTLIIFILSLTISCEQKEKSSQNDRTEEKATKEQPKADWSSADRLKEEIELAIANDELQLVKSLKWEKQSENINLHEEVEAYLNSQGDLVKVIEYFGNSEERKEGQRIFYFNQGTVALTTELIDVWQEDGGFVLTEREIAYENEVPTQGRQRSANAIEELETQPWSKARAEEVPFTTAKQVLESEGPFKTHYLTFVQGEEALFLLFGEPKREDRFVTALRVDEMTPFIFELLENSDENRFKEVVITFKVVGGLNQPEFRVLETIDWK